MRKFPSTRLRRNRELPFIRKMVSENHLISSDLIYPIFLIEGKKRKQRISSMPGIERMTTDEAIKELSKLCEFGLACVALFPNVEKNFRSILDKFGCTKLLNFVLIKSEKKTNRMARICMIGAGNVATHLSQALQTAGHEIIQVYSKTQGN